MKEQQTPHDRLRKVARALSRHCHCDDPYDRHAKNLTARDLDFQSTSPDDSPPVALVDVDGFYSDHLVASRVAGSAFFMLENVRQVVVRGTPGVADFVRPHLSGRDVVR